MHLNCIHQNRRLPRKTENLVSDFVSGEYAILVADKYVFSVYHLKCLVFGQSAKYSTAKFKNRPNL